MQKKIISIAVPKGGVGKTTTAVNLAASLAVAEKKTLLIEADPSGACSVYLAFNHETQNGDLYDVFSFRRKIDQVINPTSIPFMDFIPCGNITYQSEERLSRLTENVTLFRNILTNALNQYEYIIIDCPPYLKGITTIVLIASNSVIVPVKAGQFSLTALKRIYQHLDYIKKTYNHDLRIEGILLTMYEAKTKAWMMTHSALMNSVEKYLFKTVIPRSTSIPEAEFSGMPAVLYDANSSGARAYLELAEEIILRYRT